MTPQEATQRLVDVLNELGAAGVEVEAAICGLNLSTDAEPYGARVGRADDSGTAWEIE